MRIGLLTDANAERLDTKLIGECRLLYHFANDDGVRLRLSVRAGRDVAERVQAEFDLLRHEFP